MHASRKIPQIEPQLGPEERDAVLAVMDSGFLTEGKRTREFEAAAGATLGVPFVVAANNATMALVIALQALGIGPGDEVIVPDFTFIATANAVTLAGATPVFADVTADRFVLDLEDARRRITPRTRALLPVHLNGRAPNMAALLALARQHHLAVIEDAAQAMGSRQDGRALGTFGDAGVFSLGTTKIITSGQGGLLVTSKSDLHDSFRRIKDHGRLSRSAEIHDVAGFNSKFTDLQAALGLAQLRKLPQRIEQKRHIFRAYQRRLASSPLVSFPPIDLRQEVPWFVDVLCAARGALEQHLQLANIETRRFYLPVHSQPCFRRTGAYPVTEEIARRGLWLPSSAHLDQETIGFICDEILAASTENRETHSAMAQGN